MSGRTPVFIYASDPISNAGTKSQLLGQPEIELVHPADIDRARVAVVVIDSVDDNAAKVVKAVQRDGIPRVVLVASRFGESGVIAAVAAGVTAFLRRSEATTAKLVEAIREADRGASLLPETLMRRAGAMAGPAPAVAGMGGSVGKADNRCRSESLSSASSSVLGSSAAQGGGSTLTSIRLESREERILRLVAEGYDTGEIADRLAFSESTIKSVLAKVMGRFDARNRCHAIAIVVREGLI